MNEKDSENYKTFREKVLNYRAQHSNQLVDVDSEKYNPEDILCDDDDDDDNENNVDAVVAEVGSPFQLIPTNTLLSNNDNEYSDDYDSDSEYMQEAKERNLENMKRKIDSGCGTKRYASDSKQYSSDEDHTDEDDHMEMYRRIQMRESALNQFDESAQQGGEQLNQPNNEDADSSSKQQSKNRKKRSRWGEKVEGKPQTQASTSINIPAATPLPSKSIGIKNAPMLTSVTRSDPALLNYARQNYGTTNLSEEDWIKCEEHYKVNLLYQDMIRKRDEIDRLARSGRNKYEYDSDEDVTGGTWEHKLRNAEMEATAVWANGNNITFFFSFCVISEKIFSFSFALEC